jgi:hypothetical protein
MFGESAGSRRESHDQCHGLDVRGGLLASLPGPGIWSRSGPCSVSCRHDEPTVCSLALIDSAMSSDWPAPPPDGRRIVTGHDAAGRVVVVHDGPAASEATTPFLRSATLWVTTETPSADNVGPWVC